MARPLGLRLRKALLDLLSGWTARARTSGRRRPGGSRECRPPAPRDSPCAALLAGRDTEGHGAELILAARRVVADVLGIDATTAASKGVWPELIRAQVKASGDPDTALADWFERGAPSGVLDPVEQSAVFPPADGAREVPDADILASSSWGWENYATVEDELDAVWDLISAHREAGFLDVFESEADAEQALGKPLVYTKLGLITKAQGDGSLKRRIIWDFRVSELNRAMDVFEDFMQCF